MFTVLDLMLLDPRHPRSLAYQVDKIKALMDELPDPVGGATHHLSREQRLILQASTDLKMAEVEKLSNISEELGTRRNLAKLLDNVERKLEKVSEQLHQKYFTHTQSARQLAPTTLELPA
jgi:uncharacterized alpha-E superfamily protein